MAQDAPPPPLAPPQVGGAADESIDYENAQVDVILDLYEKLSGKRLIRDATLSGVQPMSIKAAALDDAEKLKLIEATLLLNGVTLVPLDDRTVKVISSASKPPRSEGIKIYANATDLPDDDAMVSYYMPLSYISAQEALTVLGNNSPAHGYGMITAVPSSQALILTDSTAQIRQWIALKELIDVPPAAVVTEFIQLSRADAEKVADLINKLLDEKSSGDASAAPPGGTATADATGAAVGSVTPSGLNISGPLMNERNLITGTAKIVPDTRSNSLIVVTRPVNMPFLKQLINQLDQDDIFTVPQRRPLKYVLAQDILPALEASVAQGKEEEEEIKKDATPANGANQQNNQTPINGGSNLGNSQSGTGGSSLSQITSPLQAPTQNNVPTVVSIGKTRLLADNRSNSIIVFGRPDVVARVFGMIDQLDQKPLQVYLATVIGELTVSENQELGIDILQHFQGIGQGGLASSLVSSGSATANAAATSTTTATGGTTTTGGLVSPRSLINSTLFPLAQGLTLYGAIGSTLDAYVRLLGTSNRFKVISRPSVYTTNNKLAVIASGSEVPVPATTVTGTNGSTVNNGLTSSSSTTYESILLELEIVPLINASHEVTLQIRQTNNSQGNNVNISGNQVPIILTQEINTEVTVHDKQTIVIGGLISDNTSKATSGVPWLSDIPVLGNLFKDSNTSKERDELIIMIQPTVVESDADQLSANEAEKQRTILGHEAANAATGFSENGSNSTPPPTPMQAAVSTTRVTTSYNSKTGSSTRTATAQTTTTVVAPAPHVTRANPIPAGTSAAPDVSKGQVPADPPPALP